MVQHTINIDGPDDEIIGYVAIIRGSVSQDGLDEEDFIVDLGDLKVVSGFIAGGVDDINFDGSVEAFKFSTGDGAMISLDGQLLNNPSTELVQLTGTSNGTSGGGDSGGDTVGPVNSISQFVEDNPVLTIVGVTAAIRGLTGE